MADAISWIEQSPEGFRVFEQGESKVFIHNTAMVGKIQIGRFSYIERGSVFSGKYPIRIGAFCSIAANVYCWTNENHQTRYLSSSPLRTLLGLDLGYSETVEEKQEVRIGNDVWIGREARILPGVTIGDGCVIGTRAVVSRDCEPYGVYVGVPARRVKSRCSEAVREQLQEIQWWNWSLQKIRLNADFFSVDISTYSGDLRSLVREVEPEV